MLRIISDRRKWPLLLTFILASGWLVVTQPAKADLPDPLFPKALIAEGQRLKLAKSSPSRLFSIPQRQLTQFAWSPDGKYLAVGDSGGQIILYSTLTGFPELHLNQLATESRIAERSILGLSFSANSELFFAETGSETGVWWLENGEVKGFEGHRLARMFRMSPVEASVAVGITEDRHVKLIRISENVEEQSSTLLVDLDATELRWPPSGLEWSADGSAVLIRDFESLVLVWTTQPRLGGFEELPRSEAVFSSGVEKLEGFGDATVAITEAGIRVAFAGKIWGETKIWNPMSDRCCKDLFDSKRWQTSELQWSPGMELIIAVGKEKAFGAGGAGPAADGGATDLEESGSVMRFLDMSFFKRGESAELERIALRDSDIELVSVSRDSKYLAYALGEGQQMGFAILQFGKGRQTSRIAPIPRRGTQPVTAMAGANRTGKIAIRRAGGNFLELWDFSRLEPSRRLPAPIFFPIDPKEGPGAVAISEDGEMIASYSEKSHRLQLWLLDEADGASVSVCLRGSDGGPAPPVEELAVARDRQRMYFLATAPSGRSRVRVGSSGVIEFVSDDLRSELFFGTIDLEEAGMRSGACGYTLEVQRLGTGTSRSELGTVTAIALGGKGTRFTAAFNSGQSIQIIVGDPTMGYWEIVERIPNSEGDEIVSVFMDERAGSDSPVPRVLWRSEVKSGAKAVRVWPETGLGPILFT